MIRWKKLGLIFKPDTQYTWMQSHASNPLVLHLGDALYRVYFASRDQQNRSSIAFFEYDLDALIVTKVSTEPSLIPGELGYFDDHGVYPASIVATQDQLILFYTGWNPGPAPQFYTSVGAAISLDQGVTFKKVTKSPLLGRSEVDPWMVSQPFVLQENNVWRMWYISGLGWQKSKTGLDSYYHLKYAESEDGIHWQRQGQVAVELQIGEKNIARPCVLKEEGIYKMYFSVNKGEGYRLGYAESKDGMHWQRADDKMLISLSDQGWDSQAIAYPWVINYNNTKYLFYNGNAFGKEGVGLAVAEHA